MKYISGFILVLLWSSIASAQTVTVKAHSAELRDSADPYVYSIVLMLPRYYPLIVESEDADFFEVRDYRGRTGWISKENTFEPETAKIGPDGKKISRKMRAVVVKSNNVNIRSGPGTDNKIILKADRGVAFKVISQKGEWLKVLHVSGKKGWLHGNLIWEG